MPRLPVYFLSHGGGPWPWLKGPGSSPFDQLEAALKAMAADIGSQPRAVLMVSAHWEAPVFSVASALRPPMVYDYYGFPAFTYEIQYPAPGSPALATRVLDLIHAGGAQGRLDAERGFDHGMFSVMAPMYPQADVPTVQLSLRSDLDPAAHIELGRCLRPLRDEGVLIVGSGSSYHNLRLLGPGGAAPSQAFDNWLQQTLTTQSPQQRVQGLVDWKRAPSAQVAHPREEHLLPLMVAAGAADDDAAHCTYHEDAFMGHMSVSSFRFGEAAC